MFFISGGHQPASDLRFLLMMAGDVERNPGPTFTPGRDCEECKKKIRVGTTPISCATPNCIAVCHNSHGKEKTASSWRCGQHRDDDHPMPLPPEPENAENQDDDEQNDVQQKKISCSRCPVPWRVNLIPVICSECNDACHQSCTGLTRDAIEVVKRNNYSWICTFCRNKPPASKPCPTINENEDDKSTGMVTEDTEGLRIMQWNANGINTKTVELHQALVDLEVDICLIQESKLRQGTPTPHIPGYVTYRSDRKVTKAGGGLLSFIKSSLIMDKVYEGLKEGTEVHTFRIRMSKNKWITISNVYCPPVNSKGQVISTNVCTQLISTLPSSLIAGDFNAHNPLWDDVQPPDERGEHLSDWMMESNMNLLNTGEPTHVNVHTGNGSTPDIAFCGSLWKGKVTWHVSEPIGSSDHLPIIMTIKSRIAHQSVMGVGARWKRNNVKWELFTEAVEEDMKDLVPEDDLTKKILRFMDILYEAGMKHVGKSKPRKKLRNIWISPTVRGLIKKRNRLRRDLKNSKQEWLQACRDTNEAIRESKQECWREVVEDTMSCGDEGKMWNFIRTLNGTPDNNTPNEVLVVNGKKLTSNKSKADAFIQQYADVSKLKFSKEDKVHNRQAKKMLSQPTVNDVTTEPFNMEELDAAIQKTRAKGAAGDDDIPPTFLKALGPKAKQELLDIFNRSFSEASIPQIWRFAVIIPLLKAGKSPSSLASFRPVSLTSCVVKTMERMVSRRLYQIAETRGMFSDLQAGFRRGRSCEDQILKMVQAIEDGFQKKKMHRSVLVLLDYSKAYDKVWQQRLLLSMSEQGVPMTFVRWLSAFLSNRLARVKFLGVSSKVRVMRQGLPQGAVLSPILFLFFIDNLAKELPDGTLNALFADDVNVLATRRNKEEAVLAAQQTVNIIAEWSRQWKLDLNASKSEVSFFSTYTKESKWQPTIKLYNNEFQLLFDEGDEFCFNKTPRLLGVILDRQLSFGPQVDRVTAEATKKTKMLSALSGTDWGCGKRELRSLYYTFSRSKMLYAASSYQPWMSATQRKRMEVTQNKALMIITGQHKDTPCGALCREADVCSMETMMKREAVKSAEKALRLPTNHPRRIAWEASSDKKGTRTSWRSQCKEVLRTMPAGFENRKEIQLFSNPPWEKTIFDVHVKLPGLDSKNDALQIRLDAAIARLDELGGVWTIYTDGSADAGTNNGGSAAVITQGSALNPIVETAIKRRGAILTSSFEEEMQAMHDAVSWMKEHGLRDQRIVVATDSQSLCSALQNRSNDVGDLLKNIRECQNQVVIQWIPGHSDIPGNEIADAMAKEATTSEGPNRPISFNSAVATIKAKIKEPPIEHQRTAAVYSAFSAEKEKRVTNRKEQEMLALVRSGHYLEFAQYRKRIGKCEDGSCVRCGAESDDLEHWLKCPGTEESRFRLFGRSDVGLSVLTDYPVESVKLAQRTLRLGSPQ